MNPALVVTLLWLFFGGTHVGLATRRVRTALVARLGTQGFRLVFSLIASLSFVLLVGYYAAHRSEGAPGLGLGAVATLRWPLMATIVMGIALVTVATVTYAGSPYEMFPSDHMRTPRGIDRITRHPFFVGAALLALPHVLLATHLVGAIFAGGIALLAIFGMQHQDAKLLAQRGKPYADYLAATSAVPFAAIVAGRQRLVWRELPVVPLAVGLVFAFALRAVHGAIFAHGGAWVIAVVVGGGAVLALQSWYHSRRRKARAATGSADHPLGGAAAGPRRASV
jgi:uncharacterized membrane protein